MYEYVISSGHGKFLFYPSGEIFLLVDYVSTCINMNMRVRFGIIL